MGSKAYRAIVLACVAALIAVAIAARNRRRVPDGSDDSAAAGAPRVLLFTQGKCSICSAIIPVIKDLARQHAGRMSFQIIDIVERQDLTEQHGIRAVPTLIFLDASGKERHRRVGFMPRQEVVAKLKELGVE